MQPDTRGLQQRSQVGVGVRRPQMLDHPVTPADPLSDLHRDGSRSGLHLPNEGHEQDPTDPISVSNQPTVPR